MATPAHDKYYLRTLHQEIDLFDRKLAHMLRYDTFSSDAERTASTSKLAAKRELLARTARQLMTEGIEFKPSELPRSFREDGDVVEPRVQDQVAEPEAPRVFTRSATLRQVPSPFAGTMLDGHTNMQAYKRSRAKTVTPQA